MYDLLTVVMISFTLRFYSTVYSWNREVIATGAEQTTFLDASAACELIAVIWMIEMKCLVFFFALLSMGSTITHLRAEA